MQITEEYLRKVILEEIGDSSVDENLANDVIEIIDELVKKNFDLYQKYQEGQLSLVVLIRGVTNYYLEEMKKQIFESNQINYIANKLLEKKEFSLYKDKHEEFSKKEKEDVLLRQKSEEEEDKKIKTSKMGQAQAKRERKPTLQMKPLQRNA